MFLDSIIAKIIAVFNKINKRYQTPYLEFLNNVADPGEFILIIGL